MRAHFPNI